MIEQSESVAALAAALAKAQGAMRSAAKDSINPHFRSRYADLSSVWDACRDALTANGLSVSQIALTDAEAGEVRVATMLLHSSGEWLRGTVGARPVDLKPQSVGSALTYLRRYGLAAMVGVVADDDDGEAAQDRGGNQSRPATPRRTTQADAPRHEPTTPQQIAAEMQQPLGPDEWGRKHSAINAEIIATAKALGIKPLRLQQRIAEKYSTDGTLDSLDYKAKCEVLNKLLEEKAKREQSKTEAA